LHGLQEGWAWLARFLNSMPANLYTAVSLDTFLQVSNAKYLVFRQMDLLRLTNFTLSADGRLCSI
jgi:nucleoporin GLE1